MAVGNTFGDGEDGKGPAGLVEKGRVLLVGGEIVGGDGGVLLCVNLAGATLVTPSCVCVLFTIVWRITRWTRDRQPLPSPKKLRAHRDESMGKAETSHTSHTSIP